MASVTKKTIFQLSAQWPGLGSEAKVTQTSLLLLCDKSSEVCIKTRSTPAPLPSKDQITAQTSVKWSDSSSQNKDLGHIRKALKTKRTSYYLSAVSFFIFWKVHSIQTVRYIILCHPLIRVMSSLGRNSDYFGCSSKVDLQPLVPIVVFWGPWPHSVAAATVMKASKTSSVVHVPYGRGCDHVIFKAARLHSHWSVTEWTYNRREKWPEEEVVRFLLQRTGKQGI